MRERAHEPSTRARSQMRRMVGVATVLFWASAALMTVLVLFWVAPGCETNAPSTSWAAYLWD
jgi:hypothetical protein